MTPIVMLYQYLVTGVLAISRLGRSIDMPHVFELADRIQIMRLGERVAVVTPQTHSMLEAVAIMTAATQVELERSLAKGEA